MAHRVVRVVVHRVGQVLLVPVDLAVQVVTAPVARGDRAELMSPADSAALVDRTGRADPVVPVVLMNQVDRVDLVAPQVLEAQAAPVDLVAPEAQAVPVAPVVLMDRAVPADHHRRLMFSTVSMTTVARNSAVRKTRRTASAHPTTALRHPRRSVGSAGTTGHRPGIRRRTGTGHRLPAVGTVRRLPAVGTRRGMVRRAT